MSYNTFRVPDPFAFRALARRCVTFLHTAEFAGGFLGLLLMMSAVCNNCSPYLCRPCTVQRTVLVLSSARYDTHHRRDDNDDDDD